MVKKLLVNRKTAFLALQWCIDKWGKSKYQKNYPKLICYKEKSGRGYIGEYCEEKNIIYIYLIECKSVIELIRTIIHEFTHYKQNIAEKYDVLAEKFKDKPYHYHPQEKEAFKREALYCNECKKHLLKLLKS